MNPFDEGIKKHFSIESLEKIRNTRVGIAGAGGLGSNCAAHLVRSGFTQLTIVDFDRVEASNLNRQFYFSDQVGHKKTDMLKQNLFRINPELSIRIRDVFLDEKNIGDVFGDCHVIVEALDQARDKAMMSRVFMNGPRLFVTVSGIGGWGESDRIRIRRIKDNFYIVGDLVSEVGDSTPPTSAIVSIAAAKQADLILNHVIGTCPSC